MKTSRRPALDASKKFRPKPEKLKCRRSETAHARDVLEDHRAQVAEEAVGLRLEVRDRDVEAPVSVQVSRVHAHPAERAARRVDAGAGVERHVLELHPAEVMEDEVHRRVVGDVDVRPAVAVEVGHDDSQPLAEGRPDAGGGRDVRERPVAVVAIEEVSDRGVEARMTVVAPPRDGVAAEVVLLDGVVEVPRDEEIQEPVPVEVRERGGGGPAGAGDARLRRHVGEGPVAVVAVEDVASEVRDEEVREAVVVVVGRHGPHPVGRVLQAGLRGHVGEGPVAVVAVEAVLRARAAVGRERAGLHDVEVHPAVVVVVEPRQT